MLLDQDQLAAIDRHLRKENWLLNNELITELTDHYVAGVEERMARGIAFEQSVKEIHAGFGGRKGLLKMEEDYQAQKFRQVNLLEWRLLQSFLYGPRWWVSATLFVVLFLLNIYSGQEDLIESSMKIGFFLVTGSVLGNLLRGALIIYQNRNEVNAASLDANSVLFTGIYIAGLALLMINKYLLPKYNLDLPNQTVAVLNTLLETLCFVYYMATVLVIRQTIQANRKNQKPKLSA